MDTASRRAGAYIIVAVLGGCSGGGGASPDQDRAETDWELVTADHLVCPAPCSSASAAGNYADDFAWDGDDLLVTALRKNIPEIDRFTPATMTWVEVTKTFTVGRHQRVEITPAGYFFVGDAVGEIAFFDRDGTRHAGLGDPMVDTSTGGGALRVSPEGKPSVAAMPIVDSTTPPPSFPVLTELDPAGVAPPAETPMPGATPDVRYDYAFDAAGRLVYPSKADLSVPYSSALTFVDRATKEAKVVMYPGHADADGNHATAFQRGSGVWGPVPGGGVLGVSQGARGYDLVKLTDDGQVTTVVHLGGDVATFSRLRLRDGHVFLAGYDGIWRSKQKLF